MLAASLLGVLGGLQGVSALDNGLARTPPMGWSSWNKYHRDYTEKVFYDAADIMAKDLASVGYEYINIDGGWWQGSDTGTIVRNATGFVQANNDKFPGGIQAMIDYVHSKGLKYGHYTDAGTKACNKDSPMSEGYETQDVSLFAEWGIDMIKVDACSVTEEAQVVIKRWRDTLNATGRPILFSNCRNGCLASNWSPWCETLTNMWRTSGDIQPTWKHMLTNLDSLKGLGEQGKPGAWNDPDFLELENGDFAYDGSPAALALNQAHFALWAITSSPLILGNDLTAMDPDILKLVTNRQAIEINQKYAGNAGDVIKADSKTGMETWYKPLPEAAGAVVLFNRNNATTFNMSIAFVDMPAINVTSAGFRCATCDVFNGVCGESVDVFTREVPPRSAVMVQIDFCSPA